MRHRRLRRPRAWGRGVRDWDPTVAAALYEDLPIAVIASGRAGANLVFNRAARELFEGSGDDIPAEDCSEHYGLYTADGSRLLRMEEIPLQRALAGEQLTDELIVAHPRRGPRRLASVDGGPIAGRGGRMLGAVVVAHDVTVRAALQDELRFQSEIAEHMAEAVILIKAADGEIVYVNQTASAMFGYSREELVGVPIARLNVPTDEPPAARAAGILDALAAHGAWNGDIEHVRKDGSRFWCSVSVSSFEHAAHGSVWTSVHTDVTARRAADAALRAAEERFRHVFEDSPVGIALVAADLRLMEANRVLCTITGFTRDELVGRRLVDIAHPGDAHDGLELARLAMTGEIPRHRTEVRFITKRGDVVHVAQTATVVRGPDDRPVSGLVIVDPIDAG
jgi:PAS domain S-box-containing protein